MIVAPVPGVDADPFTLIATPVPAALGDTVKLATGGSADTVTDCVAVAVPPLLSVIVSVIV